MRLNEIKHVSGLLLNEGKEYHISENSIAEVEEHVSHGMAEIVQKYKDKQVKGDSVPSAPDTTRFRATRSGMIQHETNVHIHGGMYGVNRTYMHFIKIGSLVDTRTCNDINREVADLVDEMTVEEGFKVPGVVHCPDGIMCFYTEDGTNWGGVGFYARKYSEYERKEYEKHLAALHPENEHGD